MKKQLVLVVMGVSMLVTGCASHEHRNGDQHAHAQGEHSKMMAKSQGRDVTGGHHGSGDGGHHGGGHHGMGHGDSLAGKPGKESDVDRILKVEANDSMRFIHDPIRVKTGETIKFEITNTGAIPHEFSIGTKDEHMAHGKMMLDNPGMHHGPGGSSVTIAPGATEILIWQFEEAWEVQAACNIPGHYQAGMHSAVHFKN